MINPSPSLQYKKISFQKIDEVIKQITNGIDVWVQTMRDSFIVRTGIKLSLEEGDLQKRLFGLVTSIRKEDIDAYIKLCNAIKTANSISSFINELPNNNPKKIPKELFAIAQIIDPENIKSIVNTINNYPNDRNAKKICLEIKNKIEKLINDASSFQNSFDEINKFYEKFQGLNNVPLDIKKCENEGLLEDLNKIFVDKKPEEKIIEQAIEDLSEVGRLLQFIPNICSLLSAAERILKGEKIKNFNLELNYSETSVAASPEIEKDFLRIILIFFSLFAITCLVIGFCSKSYRDVDRWFQMKRTVTIGFLTLIPFRMTFYPTDEKEEPTLPNQNLGEESCQPL